MTNSELIQTVIQHNIKSHLPLHITICIKIIEFSGSSQESLEFAYSTLYEFINTPQQLDIDDLI